MKKCLADTNALISFLTDRNLSQQETIAPYFEDAANLKLEIVIIENVVTELVYVLTGVYSIDKLECNEIILSLLKTPGIIIDNNFNPGEILKIWPDPFRDYGDAILAAYSKMKKIKVLTFDKNFRKLLKTIGTGSVYL